MSPGIYQLGEARLYPERIIELSDVVATLDAHTATLRAELARLRSGVDELRERLEKADATLFVASNGASSCDEWRRLKGKSEGVRLALDYMRALPDA